MTTTSPGAGADQRRDLVAQALRQVEPAGAVPGADQALAPFLRRSLRPRAAAVAFGNTPSELPSR